MDLKAKLGNRLRKQGLEQTQRDHIAGRKRALRAKVRGQRSTEFCLADTMGDAVFAPLDFSKLTVPPDA